MLSTGLLKVAEPPAALVIDDLLPLRRSPRTMSTVKVSLRFSAAAAGPDTPPAWISGIATLALPIGSVMPFKVFLKRNWKVMSSTPLPLLSMWISYSAFGSSKK